MANFWGWVVGIIAVNLIGVFMGSIWVWIDRRTNAPIMKERINNASDDFFRKQAAREKAIVVSGSIPLDD